MARFRYLSPEEYDALDADQKFAYINAALDHLIAEGARARLRVDGLQSPDLAAAEAAGTKPPQPQPPQQQPPQQQQQQQQQPRPAQDAQPSGPAKDQSGETSRKED